MADRASAVDPQAQIICRLAAGAAPHRLLVLEAEVTV